MEVSRDRENQQPIPSEWRESLSKIVLALSQGDFALRKYIGGVRSLSESDAARIQGNIGAYGATLTPLPQAAWETSVCQWMDGYWEVLVDLYTIEEGASDLVLSLRVIESEMGFEFQVESVHVP